MGTVAAIQAVCGFWGEIRGFADMDRIRQR